MDLCVPTSSRAGMSQEEASGSGPALRLPQIKLKAFSYKNLPHGNLKKGVGDFESCQPIIFGVLVCLVAVLNKSSRLFLQHYKPQIYVLENQS